MAFVIGIIIRIILIIIKFFLSFWWIAAIAAIFGFLFGGGTKR